MKITKLLILFCTASAGFALASFGTMPRAAMSAQISFERDIRPIFAAHCVQCHGANKQSGGLRLDVKSSARRESIIIAGSSSQSTLYQRIIAPDGEQMPPVGERLNAAQVALIKAWIDAGAAWPNEEGEKGRPREKVEKHWAWQPIVKPPVPTIRNPQSAIRNSIDAFIAARLAQAKLTMSPEADRRTLIRRLYFDLTGLPPTPERVQQFVTTRDPQAYEKLVDELLSSPRYGERWARHWLDVVHYGDTHGYDKDKPRPNAWPYRDYVIRALNEDKPCVSP